jgi:hypothetical protein
MKNKVARELDKVREKIEEDGLSIASDSALRSDIARLAKQYQRIVYQLDPDEVADLTPKLQAHLNSKETDIARLIEEFLTLDDQNWRARYDLFYQDIAPLVQMYLANVGDDVVLQSFTRRGYVRSVSVRLRGIYQFKGIEDSDLAGAVNLSDLMTFRELYGKMTDAQREELKELRDEVGLDAVDREQAEDALFGDDASIFADNSPDDEAALDSLDDAPLTIAAAEPPARYTREELERGVVLNMAIILKDRSQTAQTLARLQARLDGEGLPLKVVDWQQAAGLVGQLITVIRLVLYIALFVIFLVALVIINNSMVTATMDRVAEIGTMRAIGAQRRFVLAMFMLETLVLGAIMGTAGAILGVLSVEIMGHFGLGATNQTLRFLFAGPRLHPTWSWSNVIFAVSVIFIISVISTLYPALIATRVQPIVAMRGRE